MNIGGVAKSHSLLNFNIWQGYKWMVPNIKAVCTNLLVMGSNLDTENELQ